jgi:hypothetical protein
MTKKATILILEGAWWSKNEPPMVLPYFQAYEQSHADVKINHRTFKNADDIAYYIKALPKNSQTLVYFACHGETSALLPSDGRQKIDLNKLCEILKDVCIDDKVAFLHFGSCSFIDSNSRRKNLEFLMNASNARWVSGYTKNIGWLESTFLDLVFVSEVFRPFFKSKDQRNNPITKLGDGFVNRYEQLARALGFTALAQPKTLPTELFPARLS